MFVAQIDRQLDILRRYKFKMFSRFEKEPPVAQACRAMRLKLTKWIPVYTYHYWTELCRLAKA